MSTTEQDPKAPPKRPPAGTPESMPAGHHVRMAPYALGSGAMLGAAAIAQAATAGPIAALVASGVTAATAGTGWVIYRKTKQARANRTGQKKQRRERRWYLQLNTRGRSKNSSGGKRAGSTVGAGQGRTGHGRGHGSKGQGRTGQGGSGSRGRGRGLTSRLPLIGDRRGRKQAAAGHTGRGKPQRGGAGTPLAGHGPTTGRQDRGRLLRGPLSLRRSRRSNNTSEAGGKKRPATSRDRKQHGSDSPGQKSRRLPRFLAGLGRKNKNGNTGPKSAATRSGPGSGSDGSPRRKSSKSARALRSVCSPVSGRLAKLAGRNKPLVFSRRKKPPKPVAGGPDTRPAKTRPETPPPSSSPTPTTRGGRNRRRNRNRSRGRQKQPQPQVSSGPPTSTVQKWLDAEHAETGGGTPPPRNATPKTTKTSTPLFGHPTPSGAGPARKPWAHLDQVRTAKDRKNDRVHATIPTTGGSTAMNAFDGFNFEDASPDEIKSKLHQLPDELGVEAHKYASAAQQVEGTAFENGLADLFRTLGQVHLSASNQAQEAPASFESSNQTAFQFQEEYGGKPGAVNWAQR